MYIFFPGKMATVRCLTKDDLKGKMLRAFPRGDGLSVRQWKGESSDMVDYYSGINATDKKIDGLTPDIFFVLFPYFHGSHHECMDAEEDFFKYPVIFVTPPQYFSLIKEEAHLLKDPKKDSKVSRMVMQVKFRHRDYPGIVYALLTKVAIYRPEEEEEVEDKAVYWGLVKRNRNAAIDAFLTQSLTANFRQFHAESGGKKGFNKFAEFVKKYYKWPVFYFRVDRFSDTEMRYNTDFKAFSK